MTEYPKVIQVGTMKITVESAEEEARYLGQSREFTFPITLANVVDDVSPEQAPTYLVDAPTPQVEEEESPKKKTGAKKK